MRRVLGAQPPLRVSGLLEREFRGNRDEGPYFVAEPLDPVQVVLDDVDRRQLPAAEQRSLA